MAEHQENRDQDLQHRDNGGSAENRGEQDRETGHGGTSSRGFASMNEEKQKQIASKGGKAAHQKGTAHEWTSEEARDAGRKGGIASHQRRREMQTQVGGDSARTVEAEGEMQNRGTEEDSRAREDRTSDFGGNEREGSER